MTDQSIGRRERRRKTWSAFGNLGRKPNDYEVVTHNMNHTTGAVPLEMGPDVHGNLWLTQYRDKIDLKVSNWDEFRDPDQMTYTKYMQAQDEQETYIDSLLQQYTEVRGSDGKLSHEALLFLKLCLTPTRYLVHGHQMISAYLQQLANSSYVATCAAFQTADQLRRVQRIAYRTKQLDITHPTYGFGSTERHSWETDPLWQPLRKAVETLLVTFEWDQAFIANNFVVKPICDEIFLKHFSRVAEQLSDPLDSLIAENLYRDAERARRWSVAACKHAIANDQANRAVLMKILANWQNAGEEIIEAGVRMITRETPQIGSGAIEAEIRNFWKTMQTSAGLRHDA
jgi:hypothetical protein